MDFHKLADDLVAAVSLLTQFPVTLREGFEHHRAAWAWPLIGAVIGALAGLLAWIALAITDSTAIATIIGLTSIILMTGCLHEDGLADSFDGFWGSSNVERRLEIMRDSGIGAFGTTALIVVIIAKFTMISIAIESINPIIVLAVAASLSRAVMLMAMHAGPLARNEGFAAACGQPTREVALWGSAIAVVLSSLLFGWYSLIVAAAVSIAGALFSLLAKHKIGGHTGDTLGASQQIAELVGLTALATLA